MKNYEIKDSSIHGKGVFANKFIEKGERIGLAIHFVLRLFPSITSDLGVWINHSSDNANSSLVWDDSDGWYLVASKYIKQNDEIFMDYSDTPFYIEGPLAHYV